MFVLVLEETRPYQNPTNLYEVKRHMENVHDMSSPLSSDYPWSLNAKAKDGGRATLSVEMSLEHSTTYINCSKHIQWKDTDVSSQSPGS